MSPYQVKPGVDFLERPTWSWNPMRCRIAVSPGRARRSGFAVSSTGEHHV